MSRIALLAVLILTGAPCLVRADSVQVPAIADACLSAYPEERPFNYGGSPRMRLKGIEMFGLLEFDLSPVRGWLVDSAVLRFRPAREDQKLRWIGIYSVAHPWTEGQGGGEAAAGCTFLRADSERDLPWGPGPDFLAVSFTHGNTFVDYGEVRPVADGWLEVDVAPRLVHAMLVGASNGMLLTDESGQTRANNDIYTREQSQAGAYLVVSGATADLSAPAAVTDLRVEPDPAHATYESGAVQITWTAPEGAFSYGAALDGEDLPRWRIPFAAEPGAEQRMLIDGLPPGAVATVSLAACGPTGVLASVAQASGRASAARPRPAPLAEAPTLPPIPQEPQASGPIAVACFDGEAKLHPVTGKSLDAVGSQAYAQPGEVSNGSPGLELRACRNEFVSAVVRVTAPAGRLEGVRVTAGALGDGDAIPAPETFRLWYVRDGEWVPEVCLPHGEAFSIPTADNGIDGQTNQSVLLDYYVPHDCPPGQYVGEVRVTADGAEALIPARIVVAEPVLPDALGFVLELNSYGDVAGQYGLGGDDPAYVPIERAYHRMAHAHRANWNPLPYSQNGSVSAGMAPPLAGQDGQLRVADWGVWDARFGPLLDGSAFADLPRAGVPVQSLYLPFNECWPASMDLYSGAVQTREYPQLLIDHAMTAPPIEQAFAPEYAEGFEAVLAEYREHFEERQWARSWLHFYLNNKYDFRNPDQGGRGTSWWLLDEPMHRDDWLALRFYAAMFHRAMDGSPLPFVSRGDVSRPQWQPSWMDGAFDLMCISSELFAHPRLCRELAERRPLTYWHYGTANAVGRSNLESVAWSWQAYLAGADGILPWNSIGSESSYREPDPTALLYPGTPLGLQGPVASLRLKALRRGAQDAEYLRLLAESRGWNREDLREALGGLGVFEGATRADYAEDAGRLEFSGLAPEAMARVRDAVREALVPD